MHRLRFFFMMSGLTLRKYLLDGLAQNIDGSSGKESSEFQPSTERANALP